MDKSWMNIVHRLTDPQYELGVKEFLKFAYRFKNKSLLIPCPCKICNNFRNHKKRTVYSHLMQNGISAGYDKWTEHGESCDVSDDSDDDLSFNDEDVGSDNMNCENHQDDVDDDLDEMLDNIGQSTWGDKWKTNGESSSSIDKDLETLRRLLDESHQELYTGCQSYSKFSFIVTMLHLKTTNGWSNKSFNDTLNVFKKALPSPSLVPKNYYEAKKYIRDLGFQGEKIHACVNDCVLYRGKYKSFTECPNGKCKQPRFKKNEPNVPQKVLRYFPLKPRLQRLFINPQVSNDMRWHKDIRVNDDNIATHPADSEAWKHFDRVFPSFANDPRNVRLGLATDGFNPFGNLSNSYSIWPVFIVPYNLPPWKCMKDPYMFMSMLIPGPKTPTNIDVYLQPLIDELNDLWGGINAYDACTKENFKLRAALLWTINDFPAYSMLSGWSVKGYKACPICMNETSSSYLSHSRKICYMGHRRFLPSLHQWRKDKKNFDGTRETREPIVPMSGLEVLHDVDSTISEPCRSGKKRKRKKLEEKNGWNKKSIFFQLEYWARLKLRHNIDIMHFVKNVAESLTGTLFNIKGKTKDTWKSRKDLMDKGLKKSLHLVEDGDSFIMPMACYHFNKEEKQKVLNLLTSIKFPDGFASNISRCVKEGELQMSRMKSHDFYVFIQRLLPLSIRGSLRKEARVVLYELSDFIQILCARTMYIDVLEEQEEKIALILCKLERMFPPSFFDMMIHLLIHLPFEAKKGGPPEYRWMFPFERKMRTFKGYVTNTARPEGCIAERSLDNECLNFCSMYLNDVETIYNKVERNNEMMDIDGDISVFSCKGRPLGSKVTCDISDIELEKIHTYILNNCDEMVDLINEHKLKLEKENRNNINELHDKHFASWLQERVNNCPESFESEIRLLSHGPLSVNEYSGCMVNGYKFHTQSRETNRKTQHSGVLVPGNYGTNTIDFYGILKEVLEVEYLGQNKRVLVFKCNWFRVSDVRGLQVDKESAAISINMSREWFVDQPYILASQAKQVFYAPDLKLGKNWHVVLSNPLRKVFNVPVGEVYQEEWPQLNLNVDQNFEQSSLRRGSTPLELVDAITVSGDSTGQSSKRRRLIDEEYIGDEETDPSDLESSEKEGSSQEDYIDSD